MKVKNWCDRIRLIGDTIAVFSILFTAWIIMLLTGKKDNWYN